MDQFCPPPPGRCGKFHTFSIFLLNPSLGVLRAAGSEVPPVEVSLGEDVGCSEAPTWQPGPHLGHERSHRHDNPWTWATPHQYNYTQSRLVSFLSFWFSLSPARCCSVQSEVEGTLALQDLQKAGLYSYREWRKYLTSSWNVDWTLLSSSTLTIPRFLIPVAPCCVNSWVFTGAQFYEEKSKNKTMRWFPAEMWHVSERIWELYHAIWIRTDIRDIRSSSFVIWNHKKFKLQCAAVKH